MRWGSFGDDNGRFYDPRGLAVSLDDKEGLIFVADALNNRIQSFLKNGSFVRKWGIQGSKDGQFDHPVDITIDSQNGILFVADSCNYRIQSFRQDGSFVYKWGSKGNEDGQFNYPSRLHYCKYDSLLYVSDLWSHRIQAFSTDGQFVRKFGTLGKWDGHFYEPGGLSSISNGLICVADSNNNRIQCLDRSNGTFVLKWDEEYPIFVHCCEEGDEEMIYVSVREGLLSYRLEKIY